MVKTIFDILPNHEALLALEPEELAKIVLEHLNSVTKKPMVFTSIDIILVYLIQFRNTQKHIAKQLLEHLWKRGCALREKDS